MKKEYIGVKDLDEAQKKITLRKRNSNTEFLNIEYRSGSWLFAALVTGKGLESKWYQKSQRVLFKMDRLDSKKKA